MSRCACSPTAPPRHTPALSSARPTPPASRRSAVRLTAFRSRSSWLPLGSGPCRQTRSRTALLIGSSCSPPATGPRRPGSERCAPPSTGAMTCWLPASRCCCAGLLSSPAGRWKWLSRCAPMTISRLPPCSISSPAWWTSHSWSSSLRHSARPATGCSTPSGITRRSGSPMLARRRRSRPGCATMCCGWWRTARRSGWP